MRINHNLLRQISQFGPWTVSSIRRDEVRFTDDVRVELPRCLDSQLTAEVSLQFESKNDHGFLSVCGAWTGMDWYLVARREGEFVRVQSLSEFPAEVVQQLTEVFGQAPKLRTRNDWIAARRLRDPRVSTKIAEEILIGRYKVALWIAQDRGSIFSSRTGGVTRWNDGYGNRFSSASEAYGSFCRGPIQSLAA